jgi:hypothetical protein
MNPAELLKSASFLKQTDMRQFSINTPRRMRYNHIMTQSADPAAPLRARMAIIAAAILLLAVFSGAVFAAWVDNGPQILMTFGTSALAWCF